MAEETSQEVQDTEAETNTTQAATPAKRGRLLARVFNLKWLAVLLAATVVVQGAVLTGYRWLGRRSAVGPSSEVSLGEFRFEADPSESGRIASAEFTLHIALLEQVDLPARQRIQARNFRVQQDVEQLLRKAHSGDFDDPTLAGLKRQLQEQINETLGIRAIADVIVTDLQLDFASQHPGSNGGKTRSAPWTKQRDDLTAATAH